MQIEEGWRKVIYHSKDNSSTDEDELLPLLSENELGIVAKTKVKKVKHSHLLDIQRVI